MDNAVIITSMVLAVIITWGIILARGTKCECGGTFESWDSKKSICNRCGKTYTGKNN